MLGEKLIHNLNKNPWLTQLGQELSLWLNSAKQQIYHHSRFRKGNLNSYNGQRYGTSLVCYHCFIFSVDNKRSQRERRVHSCPTGLWDLEQFHSDSAQLRRRPGCFQCFRKWLIKAWRMDHSSWPIWGGMALWKVVSVTIYAYHMIYGVLSHDFYILLCNVLFLIVLCSIPQVWDAIASFLAYAYYRVIQTHMIYLDMDLAVFKPKFVLLYFRFNFTWVVSQHCSKTKSSYEFKASKTTLSIQTYTKSLSNKLKVITKD